MRRVACCTPNGAIGTGNVAKIQTKQFVPKTSTFANRTFDIVVMDAQKHIVAGVFLLVDHVL